MSTHSDNSTQSESSFEEPTLPRLNNTYQLVEILGEGSTARVWLARSISDPTQQFAIKIMQSKFLKMKDSISSVKKEIKIIQDLDHSGIIKLHEYGDDGIITHNGKLFINQVFLVLEYVEGSLLFDLIKTNGAMGEDVGRFFLRQMIETMEYMFDKGTVHRDIKLENILVDQQMNLKFADFGFAVNKNIDCLTSYRGTLSYMAPEIREHKQYDGRQTDVFSMGVVLFTIVAGLFPFQVAEETDPFWKNLMQGHKQGQAINEKYWKMVRGSHLSKNFKDLMQKIFTKNADERLTLEQIKEHPWYKDITTDEFQDFMKDIIIESQQKGVNIDDCFKAKLSQMQSESVHASTLGFQDQI